MYFERHLPGSAGIQGNKRVLNWRCPSTAVLHPGDTDHYPVSALRMDAVDAKVCEILLHPRFTQVVLHFTPIGWRLRVDDLAKEFARSTTGSMLKRTEAPNFKYSKLTIKPIVPKKRVSVQPPGYYMH